MKQISILLTKYSDRMSNFIYHITGRGYTHSSIALGEDPEEYYSFNYRGFAVETIEKHKKRGVKNSLCFKIQVSDEVYETVKEQIQTFQANREEYSYSTFGVFLCLLQIPFRFHKSYFCSQFVAEVLSKSGAANLTKSPSCYTPNHLISLLESNPGYVCALANVI